MLNLGWNVTYSNQPYGGHEGIAGTGISSHRTTASNVSCRVYFTGTAITFLGQGLNGTYTISTDDQVPVLGNGTEAGGPLASISQLPYGDHSATLTTLPGLEAALSVTGAQINAGFLGQVG